MPRARRRVETLTDIPNIGPAMAADLRRLGIQRPEQLAGADALKLYDRLGRMDGRPHDPCVIDAFLAAVDYVEGGRKKAWWKFTPTRKALLQKLGR